MRSMWASTSTTMMMNLIDIASWQSGINLAEVFKHNNLDGVIVKATQGTGYVNPNYASWAKWLIDNDKPLGVYHYLDTADPEQQAKHFYNTVKLYIGKCVPCADYEGEALAKGAAWLKRFLDKFRALSGIQCLVYCSLSVVQSQDFRAIAADGYKLWVAQYADNNHVNGFLINPWQKGSVAPFNGYVMHQYTSSGRLNGYNGNLDFDLFNGSYAEWCELCAGESKPTPTPTPTPMLKAADTTVVMDVLHGKYGTNQDGRRGKLKAAGYDPDSVQRKVNELYGIAQSCHKYIKGNMNYLNAIEWILKCL